MAAELGKMGCSVVEVDPVTEFVSRSKILHTCSHAVAVRTDFENDPRFITTCNFEPALVAAEL